MTRYSCEVPFNSAISFSALILSQNCRQEAKEERKDRNTQKTAVVREAGIRRARGYTVRLHDSLQNGAVSARNTFVCAHAVTIAL